MDPRLVVATVALLFVPALGGCGEGGPEGDGFPPVAEPAEAPPLEADPVASPPRHLQLERAGGPVLVPAEDSDELFKVDLESGFAESVGVGDFPHDAAALDDRIFVGNEIGDTRR